MPARREERFMRRALSLARRGLGKVSPNPLVGCVLVKGGRVVGQGWHRRFGGPHAEIEALKAAGKNANGATAFVNLEPCRHFGKTPPCTKALIAAGVARVVYGAKDPNPKMSGQGAAELRRAGLAVSSALEAESAELNRGFFSWITRRRPYVILKAAASLDGRIATARGESKWISSPQARALSRRWRAEVDAILVGAGTVLADDPKLTAGISSQNPLRVVLESKRPVPSRALFLKQPGRALILSTKKRAAASGAERILVPAKNGQVDPKAALKILARKGVTSVLVEGGAAVHGSFLDAGLADELRLFLAPLLIGGKGPSFYGGRGTSTLRRAPRLGGMTLSTVGPDLLVSGRLHGGKN